MSAARPPKLEEYRDARIAAAYDAQRWSGRHGRRRNARKAAALRRALERLAAEAGRPPRLLLDAPCGTGRFAALWNDAPWRVLGMDLSPAMLQEARRRHPGAALAAADLARLPLPDGGVDVAVCVRFLHLVREPELRVRFLTELRRVCRMGAVIDYRHGRTLRVWSRRLRHRLGLRDRAPSNPSHARIRRELEAAGWRARHWLPVRRAPLLSDKVLVVAVPS